MATRTWNGSDADYSVANDWIPTGVPVPGDTAIITAETVTASGGTIAPGTTVNASSDAVQTSLLLTNALIGPGTRLNENAGTANVLLGVTGTVTNAGAVN